jgi:hypothetical protein
MGTGDFPRRRVRAPGLQRKFLVVRFQMPDGCADLHRVRAPGLQRKFLVARFQMPDGCADLRRVRAPGLQRKFLVARFQMPDGWAFRGGPTYGMLDPGIGNPGLAHTFLTLGGLKLLGTGNWQLRIFGLTPGWSGKVVPSEAGAWVRCWC